jgi:hypothetical protein
MSDYTPADSLALIAHKAGVTQGRAKERDLIVAWLRKDGVLNWLADEIEAGEHLK